MSTSSSEPESYDPQSGTRRPQRAIPGPPNDGRLRRGMTRTLSEERFDTEGLEDAVAADPLVDHANDAQELVENLIATADDADAGSGTAEFRIGTDEIGFGEEGVDTADGQRVPNRYDVIGSIGMGANGQVFAVFDNSFHREIAAKFLHPRKAERSDHFDRFLREARITASLSHPNILPIYDVDVSAGGLPYFTMRKAEGLSLFDAIEQAQRRGRPLAELATPFQRASVMVKVCDAIAYAHEQGIIHQDIKPENIIIGAFGDVLLIDWGTAITAEDRFADQVKLQGTPAYMAPEQARREYADERSDVYCLGATLFHLLLHRLPVWSKDLDTFWEMKRQGIIQPPTAAERRMASAPLLAIAMRAMAAEPEERYASVDDLRNDLQRYLEGLSISAYSDSLWELTRRIYRRHRATLLMAGLALLLLIGSIAYHFYERSKEFSRWHDIHHEEFATAALATLSDEWQLLQFPFWRKHLGHAEPLSDGELRLEADALVWDTRDRLEGCSNLVFRQAYPGNLRASWTVRSEYRPYDFNCFIAGTDRFDGYTFHIGGYGNSSMITCTRQDEIILRIQLPEPLQVGRTYRMRLERVAEAIHLFIDGVLRAEIIDYPPLSGNGQDQWGLETSTNLLYIDDIVVERQLLPEKMNAIALADTLLAGGHYADALVRYEGILAYQNDSGMAADAELGAATCRYYLGDARQATIDLVNHLVRHPDNPRRHNALLLLLHCHFALDRPLAAESVLREIAQDGNTPRSIAERALYAFASGLCKSHEQADGSWFEAATYRHGIERLTAWERRLDLQLVANPDAATWLSRYRDLGFEEESLSFLPGLEEVHAKTLLIMDRAELVLERYGHIDSLAIDALQQLGRHETVIERYGLGQGVIESHLALGSAERLLEHPALTRSMRAKLLSALRRHEEVLAIDPAHVQANIALGRSEALYQHHLARSTGPADDNWQLNIARIASGRWREVLAVGPHADSAWVQASIIAIVTALQEGDRERAGEHLRELRAYRTSIRLMPLERFVVATALAALIADQPELADLEWRSLRRNERFEHSGLWPLLDAMQATDPHDTEDRTQQEALCAWAIAADLDGDAAAARAAYKDLTLTSEALQTFIAWRLADLAD
ncbi:MAG: protein kinase domain-containing protein [Planctomycetota bacterium]